jgi:thermostable 8-oxoguanine DNA glycosylase
MNEYPNIERLLRRRLRQSPDPAQGLIDKLSHIKHQAFFDKPEFLQMCAWKSPRPRRLYDSNTNAEIRKVSIKVFAAQCEEEKVELLTNLKGVGVPTASAILTLINPQDYGVIDIRVWQQLYSYGAVVSRGSGVGLSVENWLEYLQRLRVWARKFDVTARDVERVLFEYHKENQEGSLYRTASDRKKVLTG